MTINPTELRKNLYRILDQVLEDGKTVEVTRHGKKILILPAERKSRLAGLVKQDLIVGDPDELVHMDWSSEWKPGNF